MPRLMQALLRPCRGSWAVQDLVAVLNPALLGGDRQHGNAAGPGLPPASGILAYQTPISDSSHGFCCTVLCSYPEVTASAEVLRFLGCPQHLVAAADELQRWWATTEASGSAAAAGRGPAGLRAMRTTGAVIIG
eukprot:1160644-Pelagomonas_calceolata.AAC.5